ncbi:MAG: hypothetical protein IKT85_03980, partial [Kiritimatiellae bacterium]|nr:hypothetical protein [Kiritimatiellia bacterium]
IGVRFGAVFFGLKSASIELWLCDPQKVLFSLTHREGGAIAKNLPQNAPFCVFTPLLAWFILS